MLCCGLPHRPWRKSLTFCCERVRVQSIQAKTNTSNDKNDQMKEVVVKVSRCLYWSLNHFHMLKVEPQDQFLSHASCSFGLQLLHALRRSDCPRLMLSRVVIIDFACADSLFEQRNNFGCCQVTQRISESGCCPKLGMVQPLSTPRQRLKPLRD